MFDKDFGEDRKLEKMTEKEKNVYKGVILLISMLVIMGPISNSEDTGRFVITMIACIIVTILFKDLKLLKKCVYINKSILKYLFFPFFIYVIFLLPNLIFFINGYQFSEFDFLQEIYQNIVIAVEEEYTFTFLATIAVLAFMKNLKNFNSYNQKNLKVLSTIVAAMFSLGHITSRGTIYTYLINSFNVQELYAKIFTLGTLILAFIMGLYLKVIFLETHNLPLVMFIHFSWNICVKNTALFSILPFELVIGMQVIILVILFIYTVFFFRKDWNIEFWNKNII